MGVTEDGSVLKELAAIKKQISAQGKRITELEKADIELIPPIMPNTKKEKTSTEILTEWLNGEDES